MARSAKTTMADVPRHAENVVARGRSRNRRQNGQIFEDLTDAQKDKLLKELAVRAGLIDDSDD